MQDRYKKGSFRPLSWYSAPFPKHIHFLTRYINQRRNRGDPYICKSWTFTLFFRPIDIIVHLLYLVLYRPVIERQALLQVICTPWLKRKYKKSLICNICMTWGFLDGSKQGFFICFKITVIFQQFRNWLSAQFIDIGLCFLAEFETIFFLPIKE